MQLFYDEVIDILDVKNTAGSTIGYTKPSGIHENTDNNLMIEALLPNKVKVKVTIVDKT